MLKLELCGVHQLFRGDMNTRGGCWKSGVLICDVLTHIHNDMFASVPVELILRNSSVDLKNGESSGGV